MQEDVDLSITVSLTDATVIMCGDRSMIIAIISCHTGLTSLR